MHIREYFQKIYCFGILACYYGQVERKTENKILFTRILVSIDWKDGLLFSGRESHVWMDLQGFENYEEGDCVEFHAEVYRYLKTGNGQIIDFGLRNPEDVRKIESYRLPTDEEIIDQQIGSLICEVCTFRNHCYTGNCIADQKWYRKRFEFLKNLEPGKFTGMAVAAAYELEYDLFNTVGMGAKPGDPQYDLFQKIQEESRKCEVKTHMSSIALLAMMLYPKHSRFYIQ